MRFTLLDRIVAVEPGIRIEATKSLSLAEEYLADHFPLFPVLPGVLMLEAMTQAAAWLIRTTEDFADSLVTLREAKHIRYVDFVRPGHTLHVSAEWVETAGRDTTFKAKGMVDGRVSVRGQLVLTRANLADAAPGHAGRDVLMRRRMREMYTLLYHPLDAGGGSEAAVVPRAAANGLEAGAISLAPAVPLPVP